MSTTFAAMLDRVRDFALSAGQRPSRKKPPELIYDVDDVPPWNVVLLSAFQHVGLLSIFLIYPLLVIKEASVPTDLSANVLSIAIMALGIATLLQTLHRGPVGSGYLCPATHTAIYIAPSLAAAKLGGLPLVFGMTLFGGLIESALSPTLRRLRAFLPPEIGGLVIFFVGTTVAVVGFRYILTAGPAQPIGDAHWIVLAATLGITVALNVWSKGQARMFCALIGMAAGYLSALATGLMPLGDFLGLAELPVLAVPTLHHLSWAFSADMILPFAIAALAATIKAIGVITIYQRVNDAKWVRPDMTSISKGVLADGMGNVVAGLVGSVGVNPSAPAAGMVAATGVSSRVIGFAIGGMLILLGFLPSFTALLVLMPRPVMGGLLAFSACSILISAVQTISSRMLDARRTLVIGLAMSIGISVEVIPNIAADFPATLQPIIGSSLVIGTTIALLLNLLFRLGQRQHVSLAVDASAGNALTQVTDFIDTRGKSWGARRDVMERVSFGVSQAIETIREFCDPRGPVRIDARFDEFNIDVFIIYQGDLIELSDRRPTDKEIIESEVGLRRLAGFMLRRNADRVATSRKGDESTVHFHFEH